MNERGEARMGPAEARARDAVRGLPAPSPGADFRARLRADFTGGAIAAAPRRIVPLPWYRRAGAWIAIPAAAAAALAIVMLVNRGPGWELAPMPGQGIVVVDGRPIPVQHADDIVRALRPGATVDVPEGSEMRLSRRGVMVLLATSGTRFVVPTAPGRWFGRTMGAAVAHGTVRITTHAGFHGTRFMVRTPEADVMVTGSTLAIICEPQGTCVCVLEGRVMMGPHGGEMAPIESGTRRLMFSDGRAPEAGDMRPMEREKLGMFRDEAGGAR